jgi:DHA2 family lincomycin resistance protein-like MFS transporter
MEPFERRADAKLYLSILATGILAFIGIVIETSMNVIFPTLMKQFSISTSLVQWITTGYLLVLSVMIPTSSYLKRRFPLKRLFICGNLIFLTGTLLGAFAPSFPILLLGRLLQGAGTGVSLPLMFNIVLEQAPLEHIGFMMGAAMLVCALAPAIGPSFGGFVVMHWGWHMIFFILLPFIVLSFLAGTYAIRQSCEYGPRTFDLKGLILLAIGFTTFILGCSETASIVENPLPCIVLFVAAIIFLGLFNHHVEAYLKSGKEPLINLRPLHSPSFVLSMASLAIVMIICLGTGFALPNFGQIYLKESAFVSGCILLPGCFIGAIITPPCGRLYDSMGPKKPLLAGSFSILLACVIYQFVFRAPAVWPLAITYIFFTTGQSLSVGNTLTFGISHLSPELQADGNAIATTTQQLSGAVGTAISAAVVAIFQHGAEDFSAATYAGTEADFIIFLVLAVVHNVTIRLARKKAGPVPQK